MVRRRQWHPTPVLCLENPMDGGAWWLLSMGSHRVGHDWSDAAAAAACIWLNLIQCWTSKLIMFLTDTSTQSLRLLAPSLSYFTPAVSVCPYQLPALPQQTTTNPGASDSRSASSRRSGSQSSAVEVWAGPYSLKGSRWDSCLPLFLFFICLLVVVK